MIDQYTRLAIEASVIEVQKIMDFLQEAGQPLQLRYEADRYGPYADNLRPLLIRLEGHHLQGYGDGSKKVPNADPIGLLLGAAAEAESTIAALNATNLMVRMERTTDLVRGFESAYGLELLASVHWWATRNSGLGNARTAAECVRGCLTTATTAVRRGASVRTSHPVPTMALHVDNVGALGNG